MRVERIFLFCAFILILSCFTLSSAEEITITPDKAGSESDGIPHPEDDKTNDDEEAGSTQEKEDEVKSGEEEKTNFANDPKEASEELKYVTESAIKEGWLGIKVVSPDEVGAIPLPVFLVEPTRALFQLDDSVELSLEFFVVLISFFVIMLTFFYIVLDMIIEQNLLRFLASFVLSLIGAFLGVLGDVAVKMNSFFNEKLFSNITVLAIFIIGFTIALFVLNVILKVIKLLREDEESEEAKRAGIVVGTVLKMMKHRIEKQKDVNREL